MTQGEIEALSVVTEQAASRLEKEIMLDIVRRLKANGDMTSSAVYQIKRLRQLGDADRYIKEQIRMYLDATEQELEHIYRDVPESEYGKFDDLCETMGVNRIPFLDNTEMQNLIESVVRQTRNTFQNITNTLGFVIIENGIRTFTPMAEYYEKTLDNAIMGLTTGAFSFDTVLKKVVSEMTRSGVRTVNYASGRSYRIESASRTALMTGFSQITGFMNEQVAKQLGTNDYETSYHIGARPEHQIWQGRVYSYEDLINVCGLGSVTGLCGANCYHWYTPFVRGASVRNYTDEQLEEMIREENTPKEYYGKEYTTYEALQRQRWLELSMRKYRQDITLLKEGAGKELDILAAQIQYRGLMDEYVRFSKAMGLPEQRDRIYMDGLGRVKYGAKKNGKSVVKSGADGIIKSNKTLYKGIPKNWKKLNPKEDSIKSVNPKYKLFKNDEYSRNCVNCVPVYEMRKRGYNVTAMPATKNHHLNKYPEDAWVNPDVKETVNSGYQDIIEAAKRWPDGARAEVSVQWKGRVDGHVFIAEKTNGKLNFYDVQSGKTIADDFFDMFEEGKTRFWRIDNLEISDRGISACKAGE